MRRWLPLAGVVALLGAALLAATFGNPPIASQPPAPQPTEEYIPPPVEDPEYATPSVDPSPFLLGEPVLPSWIGWVITAVCSGVVLTVAVLVIWYFLRDRLQGWARKPPVEPTRPPELAQTRRRVRAALDEGIADLDDDDTDPRRAVIACWLRLEEEAAEAGTPREAGDTPTDLVARLLRAHQVSADLLADLAAVYRLARFAPNHAVDETMRERARGALRRLRDDLEAGQPATLGVQVPDVPVADMPVADVRAADAPSGSAS